MLNDHFPERCIGPGVLVEWPPESPILTKVYSFLCGYVRNKVFKKFTIEKMLNRLRIAFQNFRF